MKKNLILMLLVLSVSCTTNYNYVTANEDIPLYQDKNESHSAFVVVPQNTKIFINGKGKKYRKIKYGNYEGWAVNPNYTGTTTASSSSSSASRSSTSSSSSSSSYSSSPKTVHVKGYTRKDGTYVRPHTRSAPRRK